MLPTMCAHSAAFEQTQRGGCKCVAPDAAIPHYRQLIHDFYQSYAPEKLEAFMAEKFDKYTANSGTAKKPKYR